MTNKAEHPAVFNRKVTMLCEIINMSDAYTLETENFIAAAMAIALVGNGHLGLEELDGERRETPVLFGWEQWIDSWIGTGDAVGEFIEANLEAMAVALESVVIGKPSDRKAYTVALASCTDPEAFKAEWHDAKRSSMNDIGKACWDYAKALRKKLEAEKAKV